MPSSPAALVLLLGAGIALAFVSSLRARLGLHRCFWGKTTGLEPKGRVGSCLQSALLGCGAPRGVRGAELVMIATTFRSTGGGDLAPRTKEEGRASDMELPISGTIVGSGSFRCRECGYMLTLRALDELTDCPECGGSDFTRTKLFETTPANREQDEDQETLRHGGAFAQPEGRAQQFIAKAREQIQEPGEYLCYEDGGESRIVALTREWTRIGRSLAADVRFDDPTVSRRHALIVRQPDGVRVLDDRSLNGVFVNGDRVEGQALKDGDEIVVGRYSLSFLIVAGAAGEREDSGPA
ncbi:MAG: FHA domain-containing protein [Actinobacteria bacterium]|nr:MAG: FHA domain-containing protein [Actinomycetota bacterium]